MRRRNSSMPFRSKARTSIFVPPRSIPIRIVFNARLKSLVQRKATFYRRGGARRTKSLPCCVKIQGCIGSIRRIKIQDFKDRPMPIYAYKCASCGHAQDILMKVTDLKLTICPSCGKETFNKQLTAPGFQLKGSGWYATDFKGGPKPPADDAKQDTKSEAKADTKSDSKSDSKPDTNTKTDTKADSKSDAKPTPAAVKTTSATTPSTPAPTSGAKAADRK